MGDDDHPLDDERGTVMHAIRRAASRVGAFSSDHPLAADTVFALTFGVLALISYRNSPVAGSERAHDVFGVALLVVQTAAFAFRRRMPMASFAIVVLTTIMYWVSDYPGDTGLFPLMSTYAVVVHGGEDRRRVWWVAGTGVAAMSLIAVVGVLVAEEDLTAATATAVSVIHVTAAITGEVVHDRRRRVRLLEARAVRAEAEREALAREAVLRERARIARDLHDIVAHSMSVMVVQAGAAERMIDTKPERARQALAQIQDSGRSALSEMRRMLGVLRAEDQPAGLAPQPTMADLDEMVTKCVDAGLSTSLNVERAPADSTDSGVSAAIEMVGYRIVQEALTNVIKHGGPNAQASVSVRYGPDRIRIEVTDDGRGATTEAVERSTGHGLVGMRERVELFDGEFRAGPRPGGGFRVAATIPLDRSGHVLRSPAAADAHGPARTPPPSTSP